MTRHQGTQRHSGPPLPADAAPAATPGILEAAADGALVLFDPATQRAHTLNASAATIWKLCDGEASVRAITDEVCAAFDVPPAEVQESVVSTVQQLLDDGLLTVPSTEAPAASAHSEDVMPLHGDVEPAAVQIRAADRTICFHTSSDDVVELLTWLFAPLIALTPPAAIEPVTVVRVDVTRDAGDAFDVSSPGQRSSRASSLQALLSSLVALVNRLVSEREYSHAVLHAAGAVVNGRVVALPAVAGSGKSTIAAALVASGASYLTDEALGVRSGSHRVVAYPKRLALKHGSWAVLGDPEPELPPVLRGALSQRAPRHVDPRQLAPEALRDAIDPGSIALVVFPRFEATAICDLERLEPLEALLALMANTFNLRHAGQSAMDTLAELAHHTPCYRLVHSDLAAACTAIRSIP